MFSDPARTVYTFRGGFKISVVHIYPGEEYGYEAYLVEGDRDKAQAICGKHTMLERWPIPVTDVSRYTSEKLADTLQSWCYYLGLQNVEMH